MAKRDELVTIRLKHKGVTMSPYPVRLRFIKGQKEWDMVSKKIVAKDAQDPKEYACVLNTKDGNGTPTIFMYISDRALREEPAMSIAHEAAHAATYVCKLTSWEPGSGSASEPFAYLLEHICRVAHGYYGVESKVRRS